MKNKKTVGPNRELLEIWMGLRITNKLWIEKFRYRIAEKLFNMVRIEEKIPWTKCEVCNGTYGKHNTVTQVKRHKRKRHTPINATDIIWEKE